MSVSKWRWTPACDSGICINDCDLCDKADFESDDYDFEVSWEPEETKMTCEYCGQRRTCSLSTEKDGYCNHGIWDKEKL